VTFVELRPIREAVDPLVLATTVRMGGRLDLQGVTQIYAQRWAIESAFETMKAWGLEAFMVRHWEAIERLLWIVALAYTLATLVLYPRQFARFRDEVRAVVRCWGALGATLTIGKVAEAIGQDMRRHTRAWKRAWCG
jgi:hypothetical protein